MRFLLDLSFRYKFPLWGAALIVAATVAVSSFLIRYQYEELQEDLAINATLVGDGMTDGLVPALARDDLWRAFQIVSAPLKIRHPDYLEPAHPNNVLVVDGAGRLVVSAQPRRFPILGDLRGMGAEYGSLAEAIVAQRWDGRESIDLSGAKEIFFPRSLEKDGILLGTLVLVYPRDAIQKRFTNIAWRTVVIGLGVLLVLLPFNWYWGRRMALPLAELAGHMERTGRGERGGMCCSSYTYKDELGRLFESYRAMLEELRAKSHLEAQMVQSERLAAVGRLAAGVAHEINNPLAGMLTAIDTLRCHGDVDPVAKKTADLVERGLNQIKDIVGALLVHTSARGRSLSSEDVTDIVTLVTPQARKKDVAIEADNRMPAETSLPATLIRQVLINLVLNAVQAAPGGTRVTIGIAVQDDTLELCVSNDGSTLTALEREKIFEPFSPLSHSGHGLGLWVSYQIVHQLAGQIEVLSAAGRTSFLVAIPLGGAVE